LYGMQGNLHHRIEPGLNLSPTRAKHFSSFVAVQRKPQTGKFLLVLLIVLAVFFYGGATRLYTRILAGVVLGILFFQYYDLFSALNQASGFIGGSQNSPNLFNLIQWGTFINVAACAALFYATYVKSYTNNEKAI